MKVKEMRMSETGELRSAHIIESMEADLTRRVIEHREATGITPSLTILSDNPEHKPSQRYIGLKQKTGHNLGICVERIDIPPTRDTDVHVEHFQSIVDFASMQSDRTNGIIVQLPVAYAERTDHIVKHIVPHKDVDGLASREHFAPATPQAIVRLLEGHDIDYRDNFVVVLGLGRLVGAPVKELLEKNGAQHVEGYDEHSDSKSKLAAINEADIIISAMGQPGALTTDLFDSMHSRTLVDAGTAEQDGVIRGDVSDELRKDALENGWNITPCTGGVGPLTVRTLLANVVQAAEEQAHIIK